VGDACWAIILSGGRGLGWWRQIADEASTPPVAIAFVMVAHT
jgi:hypothetical protein